MKYISKWYIACLAMAFCCLVSACSEDEEQAPVEVSFTAPGEFDMSALDSCESIINSFEITANGAWSLYSDKMWVKLSLERDGWYFNDLKGGEGVHTVYIKVSNDARDFNDAQATISLVTDEKTQNVVTIHRKGIEHTFALLSSEGEVIDTIGFGNDANVWVAPETNFECSVLSYPEWLDEPEALSGGFSLKVSSPYVPFEQQGTVTFGNIDGSVVCNVPVVYLGMDANVIRISGDYTPWNWKVSLDGKTFIQEGLSASGENAEVMVENSLLFSVTCFNYDYKLIPFQVNDGKLEEMSADESWILTSQDQNDLSQLSVSVAALESGSRSGYLFAVPTTKYESLMDSLAVSTDADTFIDSNVDYVVAAVEQEEFKDSDGFIITDANGADVSCVVEEEYYEALCSDFTITDLMACNLVPGESYTINSRLTDEDWGGSIAIVELNGNNYKSHFLSKWGSPKSVVGEDGTYSFTIKVPESLDKMVIIRLYNSGNINVKALVIRPVTQ